MIWCAAVKYAFPGFLAAMLIPATAAAVAPPYLETFDGEAICGTTCGVACTLSNGWVNAGGDAMDWLVHAGPTSSSSTGPTGDHTSGMGNYLYTETSGAACQLTEAHLVSPDFDLTTANPSVFEFWYHMYGATQGTLHIDIDADGGGDGPWTLDVIPPITDNVDLWQVMTVDLAPYMGTIINVRIRGLTGGSFTSDMAIDDVRLYELFPDDVGVESIDGPPGGCGLTTAETVTVTVKNHGSNPQTGFDISYTVNGGPPVVETYMGTLAPQASDTFTFATAADLSGAGPYDIDATTLLPTDQDTGNDAAPTHTIVPLGNSISTFPHINDFESGPGDWYSYGTNNTWAFGTPAKTVIQGASSGVNAWVNGGLTGTYLNSEVSYVETQCGYDFTNLNYPAVRFRAWWSTETNFDYTRLQASTDDGQTWQTVGAYLDPVNWYNAPANAWHGEAGGYITVAHELQAYANQPFVRFRLFFSSDGSVVSNGFAFDDFEIFDNLPQLDVSDATPQTTIWPIAPGTPDVLAQTVRFDAMGNAAIDVDAITVRLDGTLPETDIVSVNLWLDDGDAAFNPASDMLIGTDAFVGNSVLFAGLAANLSLAALESSWVHITVDLAPTALPGASFSTRIDNESDIVPVSMVPVVLSAVPLVGPSLNLLDTVSDLPYIEDYDGIPATNRLAQVAPGQYYPIASSRGPVVNLSPSPSPNPGRAEIVDQVADGSGGLITPLSPPYMSALSFPYGSAAAALDYWFDLSAYNAESDLFWLMFSWNNANMNDHPLNNVFISTDAATTWAASVFHWDFNPVVPPGWHDEVVELSSMLVAAGTDYSATTVLRFQAFGLSDFGGDGLTIDNIWVGIPQYARVERVPGVVLASGGIDGTNGLGTGPLTLTYTVTNASHLPLDIGAINITAPSGVSNVTVTPANLPTPMNPGDSASFDVSFNADVADFSFQIEFPTNDPRAAGGLYTLAVLGDYGPYMDLERLPGISIPNGSMHDVGRFAEGQYVLEYTIFNHGNVDLNLTGSPDLVTIANAENVDVFVSDQPGLTTVPPDVATSFQVTLTATPGTDFQFDLVIENDDPARSPYVVTAVGTTFDTTPDAGPIEVDAGPTGPDAGPDSPDEPEGCGCKVGEASTGQPPLALFTFMALLFGLYLRRRHMRSPRRT